MNKAVLSFNLYGNYLHRVYLLRLVLFLFNSPFVVQKGFYLTYVFVMIRGFCKWYGMERHVLASGYYASNELIQLDESIKGVFSWSLE